MQAHAKDDPFVGYRRRVELIPSDGGMLAGLEDDFHRFTLALAFEGGRVSAVDGTVERTPWTVCPGALSNLVEAVRGRSFAEVRAIAAEGDQCTHLVELAGLAAAHARDRQPTRFDTTVTDPVGEHREGRVYRNGELVLHWTLAGNVISAPAAYAGYDLDEFPRWVEELPTELHEAAYLLRRGCHNAGARKFPVGAPVDPQAHRTKRAGACYAYAGERLQDTARQPRLDFSSRPEQLLERWRPSARRPV